MRQTNVQFWSLDNFMRSTRRQRLLYVDNQATWHKLVIQIQIPVFFFTRPIFC